ncbi:MAG: PAS domain S-box protein [Planctomycetes bacterium]|nr:PAS domain S-box protein [Planctomycetota bacterium]
MAVSGKSKKELIEEINILRSRLSELEHSEAESRKSEETLRESEFQYRTTLDSIWDAIHVVDTDFRIILINESLLKWSKELGIEVDQPVDRNIFDVFPFLSDKVRDEYHMVLDSGKVLTTVETNYIAGREICTESRKIPILEADKVVKVITIIRDITEKKLAEDAIRESEEKFRTLAEQSPNMIFINKDGGIVYANKKCEEITGYKREEFYSPDFDFHTFIAPQSIDLIKENFRKHLEGREVPSYEYTIINKAGDRIDVINSSKLIQYEGGNAILGIITNITERKQQENITAIQRDLAIQLNAATALEDGLSLCLEAAIMASGMDCGGIYLIDEDSGAFELAVEKGLSAEFVNNVSHYEADSDNARLTMKGEPVYKEHRQFDKSDETKEREGLSAIAVLPILNEGGVIGCLNVASHMLNQIPAWSQVALETIAAQIGSTVVHLKTAEALRESEVKYRSLISNIPDVVWTSDEEGNTTFISENIEYIYGYGPEDIYTQGDKLWFGRIHPDDVEKVKDSYKAVFEVNKQLDIEYRVRRKDGQWLWIRDRSIGAYEKDGLKYADGVFTDINERKKAQETLRHERDMAQKYLDVAGVMMMIISEDRKVKLINQKGCQILGYDEDDIIDKDWFENFLPERIREKVKVVEEKLRAGETRGIEYFENPVLTKSGEERIIAWHNTTLIDEMGNITGTLSSGEDITERKKAQDALFKEKKFTEDAINAQMDTFFLFEPGTGKAIRWNKAFTDISGYTDGEIARMPAPASYYSPEDLEQVVAFIQNVLKEGVGTIELELICKDGRKVPTEYWVSIINDDQGEPKYIISIGRDITERKKAQEALQQSEERFKALFESAPDAYFIHDLEGNFIDGNKAAEQLVGYDKDEVLGKNFLRLDLISEEDIPKETAALAQSNDGKPVGPLELTLYRKDGRKIIVETRSYPVEIGGQAVVLGIARDITERKRLEEAYRSLVDNSLQGLIIAQDERVVFVNKAFSSTTGYSEEELFAATPKQLQSLVHPDDRELVWSRHRDRLAGKPVPPCYEFRIVRKDGSTAWVEIHATEVEYRGRPAVQSAYIDITERKEAEEALKESLQTSDDIVKAIPSGLFIYQYKAPNSLVLLNANPEAERLTGIKISDWKGKEFNEIWPAAQESGITEAFLSPMKTGEIYETEDLQYKDERLEGAFRVRTFHLPADRLAVAFEDITEHKKAERSLRQSEERHRNMIEMAPDTIVVLNKLGVILSCNSAGERLSGLSKDELVGKNFTKLGILHLNDIPKYLRVFASILKGDVHKPFEVDFIRKDGSKGIVEVRASMLADGNIQVIATDLKDRKLAEQKFLEHRAQLKSLASELSLTEERERHRLATNLHDQISQALVISRIKLQALHASVPSTDVAGSLEEVCDNLDRIIQDTRTLTFDLSSPILYELGFEAAVSEWLEEQIEKQHGIKTHFKDDGRPKPLEDDIQILLFRNVRELLINIVKHAHAKNVKVSISRIRQQIFICVEDDGIGFDHAELSSGSGFGIFSIRERLEQLAGHIEIESKPGRGSKITMTAPLKGDKISGGTKA